MADLREGVAKSPCKCGSVSGIYKYRHVKKEMQEYLIAKQTVEHILGIDRKKQEEEKKQQRAEQR